MQWLLTNRGHFSSCLLYCISIFYLFCGRERRLPQVGQHWLEHPLHYCATILWIYNCRLNKNPPPIPTSFFRYHKTFINMWSTYEGRRQGDLFFFFPTKMRTWLWLFLLLKSMIARIHLFLFRSSMLSSRWSCDWGRGRRRRRRYDRKLPPESPPASGSTAGLRSLHGIHVWEPVCLRLHSHTLEILGFFWINCRSFLQVCWNFVCFVVCFSDYSATIRRIKYDRQ